MTTQPYPLPDLAHKWEREELTTEQIIGQLLAHINLLQQQIQQLTKQPTESVVAPKPHTTAKA